MSMPNANPTLAYQTRTIFHWFALGLGHYRLTLGITDSRWALLARVGYYWLVLGSRVGSGRVFGYQHVGIGNTISSHWGPRLKRDRNAKGFGLRWNIGLTFPAYALFCFLSFF